MDDRSRVAADNFGPGANPLEPQPGNVTHLVAFNELQHQIYGRIRALRRNDEWTIESFVDGLLQKAQHYGVAGDLGWALKTSLHTAARA